MKLKTVLMLALVACGAVTLSIFAGAPAAGSGEAFAQGRWLTESGNLEVDIGPCNEALCGTVVKVLGNRSMSKPGATMQAADARPAMGMKILTDFTAVGAGELKGQIYNRENGKTYDCRLSQESPDRLKVRAYKFLPLFGKTQIWTRVAQTAAQ